MQVAIKISEESYKNIKEQVNKRDYPDMQIGRAIADGIPLPKGHGRLIDCSQLHLALDSFMYGIDGIHEYIDDEQEVPTIIEADKEIKDGNYDWGSYRKI